MQKHAYINIINVIMGIMLRYKTKNNTKITNKTQCIRYIYRLYDM